MQVISKKPRVLILGSTGYVGKNLKEKIKKKFFIKSINNKKKDKETLFLGIQNAKRNIKKIKKFSPEIIINCSWCGIPVFNKKNCEKSLKDTIDFMKIIKSINSCKKIIFLGTCAEYKAPHKKFSLKETSRKLNNIDNLGLYKNNLRKIVLKKYSKYFSIIWLRLFYVFGKNQKTHTLLKYLKKKKVFINTPKNYIDFININDAVKLITKFLETNVKTGIYNIGTGRGEKIKKVCEYYKKKNQLIVYNNKQQNKKYIVADMTKTLNILKMKKINFLKIVN